jgi:hypothetical protein
MGRVGPLTVRISPLGTAWDRLNFFLRTKNRGPFRTGGPSGRAPGRGTNLKFQIGDLRGGKVPDFWCLRKYMMSRRLWAIYAFFDPFLSQKSLISRRLQGFRGKISQQAEPAPNFKRARGSFRTGTKVWGARARSRQDVLAGPGLSPIRFLTQSRRDAKTQRQAEPAPGISDGEMKIRIKIEDIAEVLTGGRGGLRVAAYRSCGEPTGGSGSESQRLRVSRRSAADPLNLLRIMPAKGVTSVTAIFAQRPIGNCVAAVKLCGSHFLFACSSGAIRQSRKV